MLLSVLLGEAGEEKSIPANMLVEEWKASSLNFLILASSKYLWLRVCTAQSHRGGEEGKNGLSWQQLDRRGPRTREDGGANVPVGFQRSGTCEDATVQFFFNYTLLVVRSVGGRIVAETHTVTSVVHAIKDNTIGPTC